MFNLQEQAAAAAAQEDGIEVTLADPATNEDTGARIVLAGPDSRRARASRRAAWRFILKARKDGDTSEIGEDENRAAGSRFLAGCVVSWSGFTRDGAEPMECTVENVLAVFQQVPWVEDECDLKFGNRANFTRR